MFCIGIVNLTLVAVFLMLRARLSENQAADA